MANSEKVVFDAGMLILLFQEGAAAPVDIETKEPIVEPVERIRFLRESLINDDSKIVIPTPALAEFLVKAGDALENFVDQFDSDAHIQVESFTQRAAIEAAMLQQADIPGVLQNQRQVIKVDRQIVAIAKTCRADVIYTTDSDILKHAETIKLRAVHVSKLPLPPQDPQMTMDWESDNPDQPQ